MLRFHARSAGDTDQLFRSSKDLLSLVAAPFMAERERWFLWLPPILAIGIAIYFGLLREPGWVTAAAPLAMALLWRWLAVGHGRLRIAASVAVVMAAGFLTAKVRTEWVRAPVLIHTLKAVVITGLVERVEQQWGGKRRLTIGVQEIAGFPRDLTPMRVRIRLRKGIVKLEPGNVIRVMARLAPPPPPALPDGYDFARAAYFKGFGAVGFALSAPKVIEPSNHNSSWRQLGIYIQRLRFEIGNRIKTALPGEIGGMANALLTGERSGISRETNDLYRDAGIFHILSISGLHMAIMGGSVFLAIRFLLASMPGVALRYPIKKWAAIAAALGAFCYLLISGGAHPTVRSFIMILVMFFAILLDRPAIALRNVALAALLILIVLPESLFNAGFQLSFAAVVALVAAYEAYQHRVRRRRQLGHQSYFASGPRGWLATMLLFMGGTIATTVIAGTATAPFAAYHFHTGQLYSVLTNMIAIPAANIVVMPAGLLAFIGMPFGLEGPPLAVMAFGIEVMTWAARRVTAMSGAVVAIPAFPSSALLLMVIGGLWLCIWRRRWRWMGLFAVMWGVYLAVDTERPSLLIGKDGRLVALRSQSGQLVAMKTRYAEFAYARWLERDGDTRKSKAAWGKVQGAIRCDLEGCTGHVGRHLIAMPRSAAALIDDCRRAAVIIMTFPRPPGCVTQARVYDFRTLRKQGAHAIYLQPNGDLRIETVERRRGVRPWTVATLLAQRERYWRVKRLDRSRIANRAQEKVRKKKSHRRQRSPELEDGHPLYWYR